MDDERTTNRQVAIPDTPVSIDALLGTSNLPTSLRIMLDDRLYEKTKQLAGVMSKADGFTPKHLIGKPEACFIVVSCALNWKIDPNFVARSTYQTPGGSIGFEGKLVQAVLEQSGRLVGGVTYEHTGDWNRVLGKYQIISGSSGKPYPKPTWTPQDAVGLGIIVRAQIRGEATPRVWPAEGQPFQLTQCFPLNSPLWATDPKTQIGYLAVRRFANQAVPHLLGGMPFDENDLLDASERARDITPMQTIQEARPQTATAETETPIMWEVADAAGEVYPFEFAERAVEACRKILIASAAVSDAVVSTAWENNTAFIMSLGQEGLEAEAQALERLYAELTPKPEPRETEQQEVDRRKAEADRLWQAAAAPLYAAPDEPDEGERDAPAADAETAEGASSKGRTPDFESGNAGSTPAAPTTTSETRPRDAFWTNDSLRIDPAPVSAHSKVPNWKTWPALIEPRLRQVASIAVLNAFYQDNVGNMDVYERACGARARGELDAAFDAARARLTP